MSTTIYVSEETYTDLFRKKTYPKESMESVIKTLVKKDSSSYRPEIEIEHKTFLLKKVKKSINEMVVNFGKLNAQIDEALR